MNSKFCFDADLSDQGRFTTGQTVCICLAALMIVVCAMLYVYQMGELRAFASLGDRVEWIGSDGAVAYMALNKNGGRFFAAKAIERLESEGIHVTGLRINDYSGATRDLLQWNQLLLLIDLLGILLLSIAGIVGMIRVLRSLLTEVLVDVYWTEFLRTHRRAVVVVSLVLIVLTVLMILTFVAIDGMRFELSEQALAQVLGSRSVNMHPAGESAGTNLQRIPASDYGRAYESLSAKLRLSTLGGAVAAIGTFVLMFALIRGEVTKYLRREIRYVQG
ncbi:MAG: hypothetical protein Q4A52_06920 [Bacillota bacterium]|nr:hypothetical protein [Bacillota bacterium]